MKTFRQYVNEQDDSTMAPAEEPMEQSDEKPKEEQFVDAPAEEVPSEDVQHEEVDAEPETQSEVYFGKHTVSHTENIEGYNVPFASVQSSHIDEIGYNPVESKLYIRYSGGSLYAYSDVDEQEWRGLADAGELGDSPSESKGKYVAMYIKGPSPRKSPLKAYERIS